MPCIIMKLRSIFKAPLQRHKSARVLEGGEMAFASGCLQHLSSLLCPISDGSSLFISDCSLLFVRREKGRQEPVQFPPQTLENQKWKRLSQLITLINSLCWIINGKFITNTPQPPKHVLSQGNRKWAVPHEGASCHVQALQTI